VEKAGTDNPHYLDGDRVARKTVADPKIQPGPKACKKKRRKDIAALLVYY